MIESDLDNTHLCIKCSSTIVGLEAYIQHRKHGCAGPTPASVGAAKAPATAAPGQASHGGGASIIAPAARGNIEHPYETFAFPEPEPPSSYVSKAEHGGKTSKTSLGDSYDLPYELGADVFFSSLQLQSVQATGPSTSGKSGSAPQPLQRQKSGQEPQEVAWIESTAAASGQHNTENLMKAVSDISESKKPMYGAMFKPISFVQESPDPSEDEEEEVDVEIDDEEDEEFDPISEAHAAGGKWKLPLMRQSPPVVPATHTGGKWKPENRPNLQVTHAQLTRLSPNWGEEPPEEAEPLEGDNHPPAGHTKGKWIPGTKLQHLEYKEEVELKKTPSSQDFWCNICCRKLKSRHIYEKHLRTSYHLKRAEPEQHLERAALGDIGKNFVLDEPKLAQAAASKKRRRRATFVKCELCKHLISRHLLGKHLISHYHYRRMQQHPGKSFRMILDNIHAIVLQSPFQCRPCSFYANTEEAFLRHWNSPEHLDASEGAGKLWCSYCRFECEDNNQMRRHLLGAEHKDVVLAINRSVPICISRKLSVGCPKCRQSFRYNLELRRHVALCHPEAAAQGLGTASDAYQGRFVCGLCPEVLRSQVALQRHEKRVHCRAKYFCSVCVLEFESPCQARRHRKTLEHRERAAVPERKEGRPAQTPTPGKQSAPQTGARSCPKCEFVASSDVEAMIHELSHPTLELPQAPPNGSELVPRAQPSSICHAAAPALKCKDCDRVCGTVAELGQHRDAAHPLLRHICTSCGRSFALAQALGRHARTCQPPSTAERQQPPAAEGGFGEDAPSGLNSWTCHECDFRAPYESELILHRLHHSLGPIGKNQLVECPLCSKSFRKLSLLCHLRQHTNEKIFACDFCEVRFARRHNLKQHVKTMHLGQSTGRARGPGSHSAARSAGPADQEATEAPGFQCETCGKVYRNKYALELHRRTHGAAERRFACPVAGCEYAATRSSVLKVHLSSHSQQRFQCERDGCGYVGKSAMHLKRHAESHREARKVFSCDQCDFRTKIAGHLRRHLRSHSGEKPYKCPHCAFSSATLENLRKHVLKTNKHPGKYIYECELCRRSAVAADDPAATAIADPDGAPVFKTNVHQEFQAHLARAHNYAAVSIDKNP